MTILDCHVIIPITEHKQIDTDDNFGGPYGCVKFGANPFMAPLGMVTHNGTLNQSINHLFAHKIQTFFT